MDAPGIETMLLRPEAVIRGRSCGCPSSRPIARRLRSHFSANDIVTFRSASVGSLGNQLFSERAYHRHPRRRTVCPLFSMWAPSGICISDSQFSRASTVRRRMPRNCVRRYRERSPPQEIRGYFPSGDIRALRGRRRHYSRCIRRRVRDRQSADLMRRDLLASRSRTDIIGDPGWPEVAGATTRASRGRRRFGQPLVICRRISSGVKAAVSRTARWAL